MGRRKKVKVEAWRSRRKNRRCGGVNTQNSSSVLTQIKTVESGQQGKGGAHCLFFLFGGVIFGSGLPF